MLFVCCPSFATRTAHLSQLVQVAVRFSRGVHFVDGRVLSLLAGQHFPGQKVVYTRLLKSQERNTESGRLGYSGLV